MRARVGFRRVMPLDRSQLEPSFRRRRGRTPVHGILRRVISHLQSIDLPYRVIFVLPFFVSLTSPKWAAVSLSLCAGNNALMFDFS